MQGNEKYFASVYKDLYKIQESKLTLLYTSNIPDTLYALNLITIPTTLRHDLTFTNVVIENHRIF